MKVTSIADLAGKRLRAGGAGFVRFVEHFGTQGVRLPVNEVQEALDQGIPDGAFAGVASTNVNQDCWNAMTDEQRETLLWGGTVMTAATTWNFYTDDSAAISHARDKGINIYDPELVAALKEFTQQDRHTLLWDAVVFIADPATYAR